MSFFQHRALDHGCFSPLSVLCPHEPEWPVRIVPLQMGVLQFPIPSARRFYKLGQALRRAIESYPEDLRRRGRRHRRAVAPGARRARGLQQSRVGPALPRSVRARSGAAGRDDDRRIRRARRLRGRGGRHVAHDARRAFGERRMQAPQLLPAVDDRHRDRDLRRHGRAQPGRRRAPATPRRESSSAASNGSKARTRSRSSAA